MTDKILVSDNGVIREAKGDEKDYILNTQAEAAQEKELRLSEAEARATQKAALLDRLGITEDEAKLLLA